MQPGDCLFDRKRLKRPGYPDTCVAGCTPPLSSLVWGGDLNYLSDETALTGLIACYFLVNCKRSVCTALHRGHKLRLSPSK